MSKIIISCKNTHKKIPDKIIYQLFFKILPKVVYSFCSSFSFSLLKANINCTTCPRSSSIYTLICYWSLETEV